MSDEYLFEKQGADAEIERLENLLSVYRLSSVIPEMVTETKAVSERPRFQWFRFAFAVGVGALVIIFAATLVSVRYLDHSTNELTAARPVETPEQDRIFSGPASIDRSDVDSPATETLVDPKITTSNEKRTVKASFRRPTRPITTNTVAKKAPHLTREEKYAYDQLMVALWITGSKLRVVQDTINRVDDEKQSSSSDKR